MITYNGIELDYRADTLQSLIIKGGLTKIDNLTDRTGTSSTQFNLPRTAKNELAFGNITTEGSELTTSGSAFITLEGNVFSQGVLYVQGYDQDNFKCLYMGNDNDFIGTIKDLPLKNAFNQTAQHTYSDANIQNWMENGDTVSLGTGVSAYWGHPMFESIPVNSRTFENTAPFFSIRHILYRIFFNQGITLNSNFLNSDYGQSLDWSNFDGTHLSHNGFTNGSNSITASAGDYVNLGTALGGNNSITPTTFIGSSLKYVLNNDITKLDIYGEVDFTSSEEIDRCQLTIIIFRPTAIGKFTTGAISNDAGILQEGKNYLNFSIEHDLAANDFILFNYRTTLKSGYSFPISGGNITFSQMTITHDNPQLGDALNWANYAGNQTQLEFLKKFLVQYNCVLDVDGDQAYIELQDEGTEPVGTSPASLPSIASEQYDLTNIAEENTTTDIDYLRGNLVYLNQKITETTYIKEQQFFPYQKMGSYLFRLNSFANNSVETYEGGFNSLFDYVDFSTSALSYSASADYATTWDDCVSNRFGNGNVYNEQYSAFDWKPSHGGHTSVTPLVHWSRPSWYNQTWRSLFINTLNQKKNNKIIEVIFRDELGTIVSNRKEYIFNNQVYKIVEWNYDIIKKLVKAKLIMK